MSTTALVWFRRDLRVHDHPALHAATARHDRVVPVFLLDDVLLRGGRFPSANRAWFLLESLRELDGALRRRGGALVVRSAGELPALAAETGAAAAYWASDVSPYARRRDERTAEALGAAGVQPRPCPGSFAADVAAIATQSGRPFTVFSPFHRAWLRAPRREVLPAPEAIRLPDRVRRGRLPDAPAPDLREVAFPPGEAAGRERMAGWLADGVGRYDRRHDALAGGTSMLSPYLHFGCVSARELEAAVAGREGKGPSAFRRQLAWRDFYGHVLLHHPGNARHAHQERFRALAWEPDEALLTAWKAGRTGFPLVDAGMRQLAAIGWMHNRARLVVGSFLTKDLHQDWRAGEAHFMERLLDGDEASNNGNWQWIASVGVDPQPFFRRMYNPARHQERFDAGGDYIRRWVPELRDVPDGRLSEPWTMSEDEQRAAGCVIGRDYPAPVVDHRVERRRAMERYRAAAGAD